MEERKVGYFVNTKCKVCTAVDRGGNTLRDLIDLRRDQGKGQYEIIKEMAKESFLVSQTTLSKHYREHSPWIEGKKREIISAKINNQLTRTKIEHREAEEEIQRLIDLGAYRIDHGEILVDKDLYMFALDRKTRRDTPISIDNLVMNLGQALVDSHKTKKVLEGKEVIQKNESPSKEGAHP